VKAATLHAVVKPDLGNRRGVGVWAFLLGLCTVGALAHVAVRMHSIQIAYALGRERRANTELAEQRRRLNIEIGMLKDPDRIIGLARETLAMGPPAPENVVRLDSGGLARSAGAAAATPGKATMPTKVPAQGKASTVAKVLTQGKAPTADKARQ
jgi:cell division protein FtsL